MENIVLYSTKVLLSENESNPDIYIAKFIICDFSKNKNGVMLNRETIDEWLLTLKHKPLVGKIKLRSDGELDFSGHNVIVVEKTDENGNKYQDLEFDTDAFGTFTEVGVEEIDGIEYIVATAEIWKRFTRACEIIKSRVDEGSLKTSWEISVVDGVKKLVGDSIVKVINKGRFIGHCMLSKFTEPAYDSSGLLEIASVNEDVEISEALSRDIIEGLHIENQNQIKEDETKLAKQKEIETSEEIIEKTDVVETEIVAEVADVVEKEEASIEEEKVEETIETSALTEWDLRDKIREACRNKLDSWCYIAWHFPVDKVVWVEKSGRESEMDYITFTYEATDDVITVSEPTEVTLTVSIKDLNTTVSTLTSEVEVKNNALTEASKTIQSLHVKIAELVPFKEKIEQAELEKIEAETIAKKESLKETIISTGLITKEEVETSEEIGGLIDTLNETGLNQIIATRLIKSLEKTEVKTETASIKETVVATASLVNVEPETDKKSIMKDYLGGRK